MPSLSIQKLLVGVKNVLRNPLIRNMMIVGGASVTVKLVAFYKETLVAGTFGLSDVLDTFFIAILVPSFIQNVFINALKNIFIPNYIIEIKEGGDKGRFQAVVFLITFVIALFSVLIAYLSTDIFLDLIFPGHTDAYYLLIKKQLFILLPCLFFWGFSSLMSGLLDMANRFLFSTIFPIISAVTVIIFLLFFREELGDTVLAKGALTGAFIEFGFLLAISLKFKDLIIGKPALNKNIRFMLRQLPPKVSSGFLTGLNNFVDQFFAAQLVVGSITAINYGVKIPAFMVSILILALGNVLLPHFSRLISDNIHKAYDQLFYILKIVFVGAAVVTVGAFIFSNDIISLLFERNEFTSEDTLIVGRVQRIIFVYVPFYLCTLILVKFLTSINKNKFMAWTSLLNLFLNIILNFILVQKYDLYGLAMSTTIVYIISSFIYFIYTYKQYKLTLINTN
ncbi:murein biosynthesis integral membrane protein MurJ [Ascidiimonas sp. W6]|uniref:murein biosynthesis integral membrane protein MurJ n=1 Tax=Ascidiimonas meishanensis TaxID=3128903 RepID=UPI0030EDBD9B